MFESLNEAETLCRAYSTGTNTMMDLDRVRVLEQVRMGILFFSHLCIDDFEGDISGRRGKETWAYFIFKLFFHVCRTIKVHQCNALSCTVL